VAWVQQEFSNGSIDSDSSSKFTTIKTETARIPPGRLDLQIVPA